jgi:PAS domain S-box-containing protein
MISQESRPGMSHNHGIAATARPTPEREATSSLVLLLIEDNSLDVRLIKEMLPDEGITLISATTLAAGLEYLRNNCADTVLLDLYLPDSQGIDTLRQLQSSAPDVAIIAVTRAENEDDGALALHNGAQDYLIKGQIDSRTLLRAIRYASERHRSEQALRESDERLRLMFEQAAVGLAYVDLEGHFIDVNQKLCNMVGYSRADLLERSLSDITLADDQEHDRAHMNGLLEGLQDNYSLDKRYVRQSGETVWVSVTVTLGRASRGQPKYFLAVVQDIAARKEAEQAKTYLAAIVESSQDGIIGKTLDGTIVSWNAGAERIYGYSAEEAIGQSISFVFPPGTGGDYDRILARIRRGESIAQLEMKRVRKDGKQVDIALTLSPIKDAQGNVIGASAIERDITALKWAQAAQQESEQRLRQLTENISEVLWLSDVQSGQMLYVSPPFVSVWGLERERLYEQAASFMDLVHPDDRQRVIDAAEKFRSGGFDEEFRIIRPDEQERWIHARTFPIHNEAGEVYRIAGIAEDITEYKRLMLAEQEQRVLAEALRDIANALNSAPDMSEVLDRLLINIERVVPHDAAEILFVEEQGVRLMRSRGYASRGLEDEVRALHLSVEDTPNLRYMSETRQPLIIPDVQRDAGPIQLVQSPALFWRSYAGVPICSSNEVIGFINLGSVTPYFFTPIHADRLQGFAEQAAIAIHNAQLHEQARELAAYHERQRLARDFHDAVSQTLFSATITAETLARRWQQNPQMVGPKLAELHRLTRGALAETRAVLLELRPEALKEMAFDDLVLQLIEATQSRKRLNITSHLEGADSLPVEAKLLFYRITQEALNNIVKHAQATQVDVSLSKHDEKVMLEIRDNGQGFDPATVKPASMGLGFMRERAESMGAVLEMDSGVGRGTRVRVTWANPARKEHS